MFEVGVGGSNIPLRAIILCGVIALVFILIGNLKGMLSIYSNLYLEYATYVHNIAET